MYPCKKSASRISERNLRRRSMHGPRHTLALRKLDTCLLVTTLCTARSVSSDMRIDAVEVPRTLADTERMANVYRLKAMIKFGSIVKYGSILPYFVIAQ